jgi:tetratricopeptide (TPR) repeat protein
MRSSFRTALAVLGCVAALGAGCRKTSAAHTTRGNAFFDQALYQEAILEFRNALQTDPKLGEVRKKLADAYVKVNDPRNAMREYVRAADLLPENAEAQRMAARVLLLARSYEDARVRAERAIALDPKNVEAQLLRGNALAGLKDFDAAMSEYQDAITLDPTQSTAYSNLGTIQLAQGKRAEAEETFKRAVAAAPKSIEARLALANFYWATSRQAEAESMLKETLEIDKNNLVANRALGLFYMASGRAPEAEPYFTTITHLAHTDAAGLALADYYTISKRPDDARKLLRELAAHDPVYATATVRLAALDAGDGNRAQAQARLHEVLQKHPKDATALLLSARLYVIDGKRSEARQAVATVIASEPSSANAIQAYLLSGQIEAASDRSDLAIKAYEQVLKMQAKPLVADLALARLYLTKGDASKTITYAQQALVIQPGLPEAQNLLIRGEIISGDVSRAKKDFEELQKKFPNSLGVEKLNAIVQLATKQPDAARAAYARALKAAPDDLESLAGLVQIDLATGHAKDAAARIDERLKQAKPSVALLILAARAHAAAGDLEPVETLLRQAIDLDPDRLQAYSLLGSLFARQKRLEEAKVSFQDVLTRNPKSVGAATMIAMLLEAQKRVPEAEKQYEQVLAIDGHAAVAANNLAWIYVASNRKLDEALQLAQTAQQQLPDEPNVNDTLGWIYYQKKMAPQAITHLEHSVEKSPNDPTHHFHLGMAYVQTGAWDKARQSLKRAFALQPDFEGSAEAKKALTMIGA